MRLLALLLGALALLGVLGAVLEAELPGHDRGHDLGHSVEPWGWDLPPGFPEPRVPDDNPMSTAKVVLGRQLFYDTRLSLDGTMSCASCHRQELAFTDGRDRALGVTGATHHHAAMTLTNVAYALHLGWDDPRVTRLEDQLTEPLFGHEPIEMGLRPDNQALEELRADWQMRVLFESAFPFDPDAVSWDNVAKAIASFERTLISGDSPFDRYWHQDDPEALSSNAKQGMRLFFSKRLGCSSCHGGFNLSGPVRFVGSRPKTPVLHNTGLYRVGPEGLYPESAPGRFRHTRDPDDHGRFRAPTLRNIAVTAPYMHDGSIATLDGVLDHYAAGGRARGPRTSPALRPFTLSDAERRDLLAFFDTLTDRAFLTDPATSDPRSP